MRKHSITKKLLHGKSFFHNGLTEDHLNYFVAKMATWISMSSVLDGGKLNMKQFVEAVVE